MIDQWNRGYFQTHRGPQNRWAAFSKYPKIIYAISFACEQTNQSSGVPIHLGWWFAAISMQHVSRSAVTREMQIDFSECMRAKEWKGFCSGDMSFLQTCSIFFGVLLPFPIFPFGKESVNTPRPPVTCKFDQHKTYNPLSTSPCLQTLGSEIVPQSVCCDLSPGTPGKNRHSRSYVKLRLHQNQWNSFGKITTCKSGLSRLRALRRQPSSGVPLFKGTQVATKVQLCILSHSHHRY